MGVEADLDATFLVAWISIIHVLAFIVLVRSAADICRGLTLRMPMPMLMSSRRLDTFGNLVWPVLIVKRTAWRGSTRQEIP